MFLLTNRLNQDVFENLFSIFRQKGGYNKNPTSRTLRTSFRSSCIYSLCNSKETNCEENDVIGGSDLIHNIVSYKNDTNSLSDSDSVTSLLSTSSSENSITNKIEKNKLITLENCSVTYFSGYLAYKCIEKFNCEMCKLNLISKKNLTEKNQLLLIYKNYSDINKDSGLKVQSDSLKNIINRA